MLVELHILQNFAPCNLNRDDTNAPKDCDFGGVRRARISSQCIKRAIRNEFSQRNLLDDGRLSKRTKLLVTELVKRVSSDERGEDVTRSVIEFAVEAMGLGLKEGKTQYLLFLGAAELDAFARLIADNWDDLSQAVEAAAEVEQKSTGKAKKKQAKAQAPDAVNKAAVKKLLDGGKAADLALFGRMLADLPEQNIDAACQVAHAISTNRVDMEFDFYTAVDDLQPEAETGAGMMGTVEFNSSCFYRYANINVDQLVSNLDGDDELASKSVEAFLRASVTAIPTGKQNSMAAQNPPSFVLAVVRDSGLWSLANAFVNPVRPLRETDLVDASIQRIDDYFSRLVNAYGDAGIMKRAVLNLDGVDLECLKDDAVQGNGKPAFELFVDEVLTALNSDGKGAAG